MKRLILAVPLALAMVSPAFADVTSRDIAVYNACTHSDIHQTASFADACDESANTLFRRALPDSQNTASGNSRMRLLTMGANCMSLAGIAQKKLGFSSVSDAAFSVAANAFHKVLSASTDEMDLQMARKMLKIVEPDGE